MTNLFILLQYLLPQHSLSRLAGIVTRCQWHWFKNRLIRWFIKRYKVNMSEALEPDPRHYTHFNAFFTRALKKEARPITHNSNHILAPADGCISQIGMIDHQCLLQAKDHHYSLSTLLGNQKDQIQHFQNGHFVTIYLAPNDYHRVHMPISGTLRRMTYVPGTLFSVNHTTVQHVPNVFARNERVICIFDTGMGPMALILIGAMLVGSIETVWANEVAPMRKHIHTHHYEQKSTIELQQGEEMGRFKLGSTVIVLFSAQRMVWEKQYRAARKIHMGTHIGSTIQPAS